MGIGLSSGRRKGFTFSRIGSDLNTETAVVVVGGSHNGLGIIRSLAPYGIPCWLFYNNPNDPCLATRFARKQAIPGVEMADIRPALESLRTHLRTPPLLLLTNDQTTASVSRYRDSFTDLGQIWLPDHDRVMALLRKDDCRPLYDAAGLDQPVTVDITPGEADDTLDSLTYPCVLKASEKRKHYDERFEKGYVLQSAEEARQIIRSMVGFVDKVVVQERIEGPDSEIFFCLAAMDQGGDMVASFVGRKLNSWPPLVGSTARCMPAPEAAPAVTDATARFFKTAGVTGLAGLEFKRDARTGRYYVIEPTVFRSDFQIEIATLNGVNLPLAHYCLMTGQPVPEMHPTGPKGWIEPAYMSRLGRSAENALSGIDPPRMVDAYWRWNDPGPWLHLHTDRFRRAWSKMTTQFGTPGRRSSTAR